jgi:(S)-2-hydroxyglutarate dehydrogenase
VTAAADSARRSAVPPGTADIAVVGAGIVGLAAARALQARRPGRRIVVLEAAPAVAAHQTSHNSGVIHAGIYYAPGSLKARLCVEGARRLYEFCDAEGIAARRSGKLIVAVEPRELPALDELERRGRANGVPGLRRVDAAGLAEFEPHCRGAAGLHSPATGVVDFAAVAEAIARGLEAGGASVAAACPVTSITPVRGGSRVVHGRGITVARQVLTCAGAWSDRLAVAAGAPADPRIVPFRGAYLAVPPPADALVRSMIYPVPDPALPFLGIHLTRHADRSVTAGPSALLVGDPQAYALGSVRPRELLRTLAWPGTPRMLAQQWRSALAEARLAASRRAFAAAAARFVPELADVPLELAFAGVRAQALGRDGTLVDDFVVSEAGGAVHVRNAPSPAATAALAIGDLIADRVEAAAG